MKNRAFGPIFTTLVFHTIWVWKIGLRPILPPFFIPYGVWKILLMWRLTLKTLFLLRYADAGQSGYSKQLRAHKNIINRNSPVFSPTRSDPPPKTKGEKTPARPIWPKLHPKIFLGAFGAGPPPKTKGEKTPEGEKTGLIWLIVFFIKYSCLSWKCV